MNLIVALVIGILFGSSIYLMLNRNFFKLILGVIVFGYASIYFLFVISGVTQNNPPLIREETAENLQKLADPLPQALTLTAIVIGIGVQLFVIVLLKKVYGVLKIEDLDELQSTDEIDQPKNKEE
ncbi:NADH-quinone oxidoreductase subunit K [Echinicola jeungdonensis]|uniref:NADH-quinone oxidoreductase subunit K n=1 Tax=Echinicola jeungdonensis TaxID=709343 RepID=A0ABV5J0H8_9BACT|nr:NADH-quinone oxidoreductase subunit K [Echinicola jeungdonensis]MDN3671067.1 NADH-quinone oxidoreductase subunit K [Echinicola jeungdonensis]